MKLWTPNQQLQNGRFTIQEVLGGGGFGITYSAKEQYTNNVCVLKTLNHLQQNKADFSQRQVKFVNEALRLARCHHPHIVQVYEVIEEEGLWAIVMEYIDGEDLGAYIDENGKLSEEEALRYTQQVGTALAHVHKQGFLHRDVKPNNILLRSDRSVQSPWDDRQKAVLIDFGLAREFTVGKTGSMTNSKTEGYAPIEQYERRGSFGAHTDVYALAASLYSFLTAEVPIPAIFRKYAELPPPKQHNPNISDRVNDAIMVGMALEPQDRPQTVGKWLELLIPSQISFSIPTKKFEFEYATIAKNLEITSHRGQAESLVEDLGNGIILELIKIPGGSFTMGTPAGEEINSHNECPQHRVILETFFMGKFPITQEQYQAIMGNNPSKFQGSKRPVEKVSWYNAVKFCAKLSQLTGKNYHLPSEGQWEYACRAQTITPFHFGETITTDLANYNGDRTYGSGVKGVYREQTTDVGTFPGNPFGLYDMHGNLYEWCEDHWHDNYKGAPVDGSAWVDREGDENYQRILRGGSWYNDPVYCRSAARLGFIPHYINFSIGFRVSCVGTKS